MGSQHASARTRYWAYTCQGSGKFHLFQRDFHLFEPSSIFQLAEIQTNQRICHRYKQSICSRVSAEERSILSSITVFQLSDSMRTPPSKRSPSVIQSPWSMKSLQAVWPRTQTDAYGNRNATLDSPPAIPESIPNWGESPGPAGYPEFVYPSPPPCQWPTSAEWEEFCGQGRGQELVTGRQRDHPDWTGGLSPAAYVYQRIQRVIPAGQQMPPSPSALDVLMFFQPSPDPPAVAALPVVPIADVAIDPRLLAQPAALAAVPEPLAPVAHEDEWANETDSDSSSDGSSDTESVDAEYFRRGTPRGRRARTNYAIPQIPAYYPRPVYQRAQSPTPCKANIDEMQSPAI